MTTPAARPLAVITGASSGIGSVFARRLAPGQDLLLIARRKERLDELAAELHQAHGTRVETMQADLATDDGMAAVADHLKSEPRLVLLVNNAGFGSRGQFWQTDLKTQEDMHRLHVMATLRLTHAALPGMVARNHGGIINVASVAAFVRSPGSVSYCATKSWMAVFTEALWLELRAAKSNVKVQALCPGYTYSEFHDSLGVNRSAMAPASMWLSADEVVDASLEGLSRGRLFVVPGWRYRFLTSLVSVLPSSMRLMVESAMTQARRRALTGR